jgi:hypothetical protein
MKSKLERHRRLSRKNGARRPPKLICLGKNKTRFIYSGKYILKADKKQAEKPEIVSGYSTAKNTLQLLRGN